jgi:hypothetical protein
MGQRRYGRSRRAPQHAEAVQPTILHYRNDEYCEDGHEEQQSALLLPKMHKEHKRQASLGNDDQQHSGKHLRAVDLLIGNHKLQPR